MSEPTQPIAVLRPEPEPLTDPVVEELNKLAEALTAAQLVIEALEKSTAETFNIKESYNNPVRSIDFWHPFEAAQKNLVDFAAQQLTDYPEILDVKAVAEAFKGKPFDAQAIKDHVRATFDGKADELALAQIRKEADRLVPWGEWDHKADRRERKVEVQGRKLKLRCWLDWSYGRPFRLYDLARELEALERLARVTYQGMKPSEALKTPSSAFWRYGNAQSILDEDLTKKQDFHGLVRGVKIHKNGSLYVWMLSEHLAKLLAAALTEA